MRLRDLALLFLLMVALVRAHDEVEELEEDYKKAPADRQGIHSAVVVVSS